MSAAAALALGVSVLTVASSGAADDASADRMAAARDALIQEMHSKYTVALLDRLEYQFGHDHTEMNWKGEISSGSDLNRLVLSSQGEAPVRGALAQSGADGTELRASWRHAVNPWFDSEIGVRHDFRPRPTRSYLVAGFHGTAPYWIETDVQAFLSDHGETAIRIEAGTDLRITQRLVLRPTAELNGALRDVPELGVASGLSESAFGLRLRYEFNPAFAPYFGAEWRHYGRPSESMNPDHAERDTANMLLGLRLRY